jgi:hypothetical protein
VRTAQVDSRLGHELSAGAVGEVAHASLLEHGDPAELRLALFDDARAGPARMNGLRGGGAGGNQFGRCKGKGTAGKEQNTTVRRERVEGVRHGARRTKVLAS